MSDQGVIEPGAGQPAGIPGLPAPAPEPAATPISQRTGEPARPWTVVAAAACGYLAVAVLAVATGWIYLDSVTRFAEASWLMGRFETGPGSLARVLLAVAVTAAVLAVAVPAAITGYYAWAGYGWTRWSALLGAAASALCLLLTPLACAAIGLLVLQAVAVWLPPSGRFFAVWRQRRHPAPELSEPVTAVAYGPLPRYR
jgi:hypothetical protein